MDTSVIRWNGGPCPIAALYWHVNTQENWNRAVTLEMLSKAVKPVFWPVCLYWLEFYHRLSLCKFRTLCSVRHIHTERCPPLLCLHFSSLFVKSAFIVTLHVVEMSFVSNKSNSFPFRHSQYASAAWNLHFCTMQTFLISILLGQCNSSVNLILDKDPYTLRSAWCTLFLIQNWIQIHTSVPIGSGRLRLRPCLSI